MPLGTYLLYGIVIGPISALLTVWIFALMLKAGWWKEEADEEVSEALAEAEQADDAIAPERRPSLAVSVLPIIVPLLMIAFGAFAELLDFSNEVIEFFGNANVALFIGLLGAYAVSYTHLDVYKRQPRLCPARRG